MKTLLLTLTYGVGIGELILAIYFWVTNSKSEVRRVMGFLALTTGLWVITSVMIAYRPNGGEFSLIVNAFIYMFGVSLLTTLVYFTLIFPFPLVRLDWLHKTLMYVPVVFFSIIGFTTRLIEVNFVASANNAGEVIGGPLMSFYNNYLIFLFLLAVYLLVIQFRRNSGPQKSQVGLVLGSVLIGGLPAVIIDLIIATYFPTNVPNYLYGVLASSVWLGTTAYIVKKK